MATTKLKVGAATFVLAAIAALIVWQQQQAKRLTAEVAALRGQLERAEALQEENQRLRDQGKTATDTSQATARELLRLRAQAGAMRQLEQDNARLKSERDLAVKQAAQEQPEPDGPYDRLYGQGANTKMRHAMRWGIALSMYSRQPEGLFPERLQEVVPFLPADLSAEDKAQTALTADQYELLYHGRLEDMTNPPPEGAIIIREKQPWQTTQGAWARAYIFGDGHGLVHSERDGKFESWEGPRLPKLSGQ